MVGSLVVHKSVLAVNRYRLKGELLNFVLYKL